MYCTIECYDKNGKLVELVGAHSQQGAKDFMEDHKDIYSKIKIMKGLRPDCKKMLQEY